MSTTAIILCCLLSFCVGGVVFSRFSYDSEYNAKQAAICFVVVLIVAATRFFVLL